MAEGWEGGGVESLGSSGMGAVESLVEMVRVWVTDRMRDWRGRIVVSLFKELLALVALVVLAVPWKNRSLAAIIEESVPIPDPRILTLPLQPSELIVRWLSPRIVDRTMLFLWSWNNRAACLFIITRLTF